MNKLEEVEASLEAAGGAIPKRSVRAGSGGGLSRRSEDRMARRLHEYELPGKSFLAYGNFSRKKIIIHCGLDLFSIRLFFLNEVFSKLFTILLFRENNLTRRCGRIKALPRNLEWF